MAQIIEFPKFESNGYKNLLMLIELTNDTDVLNFYAETLDIMVECEYITPAECEMLSEQIRKKRLEISRPVQKPAVEASDPGLYVYCPEMGEGKPACQIEAERSYYGRHYYLRTPLELRGKGIRLNRTLEEKNLKAADKYKAGWLEYLVTERAFDRLLDQYTISMESLLD